jgi:uncharacterized membrane protein
VDLAILDANAPAFIARWIHLLGGVAWIGLLWYFNFVQGEYFKVADGAAKSDAIRKLVPRALFWFRWAAVVPSSATHHAWRQAHDGLQHYRRFNPGTLMFLNVWLVIWPNQKIVIASAEKLQPAGSRSEGRGRTGQGRTGIPHQHHVSPFPCCFSWLLRCTLRNSPRQ